MEDPLTWRVSWATGYVSVVYLGNDSTRMYYRKQQTSRDSDDDLGKHLLGNIVLLLIWKVIYCELFISTLLKVRYTIATASFSNIISQDYIFCMETLHVHGTVLFWPFIVTDQQRHPYWHHSVDYYASCGIGWYRHWWLAQWRLVNTSVARVFWGGTAFK